MEAFRNFKSSGLSKICVKNRKEVLSAEVSNIEFSPRLSVQWGTSPAFGSDGGWTSHRGCRNLEMTRVRRIHMGATWP
jgi:hypothetical protein